MDAGSPVAAFAARQRAVAYLRRRLGTFVNPLVYTFWIAAALSDEVPLGPDEGVVMNDVESPRGRWENDRGNGHGRAGAWLGLRTSAHHHNHRPHQRLPRGYSNAQCVKLSQTPRQKGAGIRAVRAPDVVDKQAPATQAATTPEPSKAR
jgi:hypothetical protein